MAAPVISATLDTKAMDRADKRLAGYAGRPLQRRAQQAYIEGARLMVRPVRQQIRAAGLRKTGRFERSVKARKPRLRAGEMAAASTGPVDAKRHLLIRGHRIVTPGGRDTGRRTAPHAVVDRAFAAVGQQALDFIATRTLAVTGESFSPF